MKIDKKISIFLVCIIIGIVFVVLIYTHKKQLIAPVIEEQTNLVNTTQQASNNKRKETAIEYNVSYQKYISNKQEALSEIKQEADKQKAKYHNPEIKKIEEEMEKKYNICAVTLGEMDMETANQIQEAFDFMYVQFPKLSGKITNLTLGNFEATSTHIALTENTTFISNPDSFYYPQVQKFQIVLSARNFLNKTRMNHIVENGVSTGHWTKDTNVQALIAHELGHALMEAIAKNRYGLEDGIYIQKENYDSFIQYINDGLAQNQTTTKEIVETAYERYKKEAPVTYEEFCKAISGYALGVQEDGGYSYSETCAEACSDYFLHKENASKASLIIMRVMKEYYERYV